MNSRSIIHRLRRLAWKVLGSPPSRSLDYVGSNGCIRCAASFAAWNQVPGDYLEFGVFRGQSFSEAYHSIWRNRQKVRQFVATKEIEKWIQERPRFFAFDSFCGLPGGEADRHLDYSEGAYACTETQFTENIVNNGVDMADVRIVPGFYDETLTADTKEQLSLQRAAIILIDCDLYESTVPVLEFITDLVDQGTILIFDDWYRFKGDPNKGEQRACNEWLQKNPHINLVQYWQQGPQSVAFLVNIS